jgi:hypothetical protein
MTYDSARFQNVFPLIAMHMAVSRLWNNAFRRRLAQTPDVSLPSTIRDNTPDLTCNERNAARFGDQYVHMKPQRLPEENNGSFD